MKELANDEQGGEWMGEWARFQQPGFKCFSQGQFQGKHTEFKASTILENAIL